MIYLYIYDHMTMSIVKKLFLEWEYVYMTICGSEYEMLNWIIIESEKDVYLVFILYYEWIILTL